MKIGVVIVCAGSGKRLGKIDKVSLRLFRKPLFHHAFSVFVGIRHIEQIALVMQEKHFALAKKTIVHSDHVGIMVNFVKGGFRRQDSVRNGLNSLSSEIDYVLIHDGARPLVSRKLILHLISELKKYPAVICATKSRDTLKTISKKGFIEKTLDRNRVVCVQTPQGFKKELLIRAFKKQTNKYLFDDAQAVESLGTRVRVIDGEDSNIKITYPDDIEIAKSIISRKQ